MVRTGLLVAGTVLLAGAGLVACGDDGGSSGASSSAGPTLNITAEEYSFGVDGQAQAGLTTVTFTNQGQQPHIASVLKLQPGKTLDDALKVLGADNPDEAAMAAVFAGDPSTSFSGFPGLLFKGDKQTTITKDLTAGTYALVCYLPSPDGKPHFLQGMAKQLTVGAAVTPAPSDPKTTGQIAITDGAFTLPSKMESGTYLVVNNGKEPHEINIAQVPDGTTVADVDKSINGYFNAVGQTPPPTVPDFPANLVGGFSDSVPPGGSAYMVLNLPKGNYIVAGDSDDSGNTTFSATFVVK